MVQSIWIAELKFEIFTIDIGVWRDSPEGTTNSIWIRCNHLKSIVSVCWRFVCNQFRLFGQVEIVCRFRGDRVSISSGALKPKSCVDFTEIVCRFRQVFVGVRLRFEKSSLKWRIVGSEKTKSYDRIF